MRAREQRAARGRRGAAAAGDSEAWRPRQREKEKGKGRRGPAGPPPGRRVVGALGGRGEDNQTQRKGKERFAVLSVFVTGILPQGGKRGIPPEQGGGEGPHGASRPRTPRGFSLSCDPQSRRRLSGRESGRPLASRRSPTGSRWGEAPGGQAGAAAGPPAPPSGASRATVGLPFARAQAALSRAAPRAPAPRTAGTRRVAPSRPGGPVPRPSCPAASPPRCQRSAAAAQDSGPRYRRLRGRRAQGQRGDSVGPTTPPLVKPPWASASGYRRRCAQ